MVGAQGFDGVLALGGCDKNMPGCLIALARLDRPAVFVYGGTIRPGAEKRDIVSVFEAVGGYAQGTVSEQQLKYVERTAIPGPGSCAGMYTANTMASAIEALGMSLPNSSAQDAISSQKARRLPSRRCRRGESHPAGNSAAAHHDAQGVRERDHGHHCARRLHQRGAAPLGHRLVRQCQTAGWTISPGSASGWPVLADLRPSGRYSMSELVAIGGIQPLMKTLLDAGLLHGDCLTVTGETLAHNLRSVAPYADGQEIIRPLSDPIKKDSHLVVLYGNLAPTGAVAKITGKEGLNFKGKARVFDSEEASLQGILGGKVRAGDVVVIRYEGPKGGPGHARDAESYGRHRRQRPGKYGRAHHGRPLFGRQSWFRRRPCLAGGGGGRTAGAGQDGR